MRAEPRGAARSWFRGTGVTGMLGVSWDPHRIREREPRTRTRTRTRALVACSVLRTLPVSHVLQIPFKAPHLMFLGGCASLLSRPELESLAVC